MLACLLCIRLRAGSVVTGITEPLLQLCCLDASIAIKPVLERFQSVVITSGTLSPIDLYPKLLNFQPVLSASLPMSTFRPCLLPLIVTRGSDQIAVSTRFELRKDLAVVRNYGQLLIDIAACTPDGVCCFFTSYQYMEYIIGEWDRMRILQQVYSISNCCCICVFLNRCFIIVKVCAGVVVIIFSCAPTP